MRFPAVSIIRIVVRLYLMCAVLATVTGCSLVPGKLRWVSDAVTLPAAPGLSDRDVSPAIASDFERSRLITRDLVSAMVQIPALAPATTTLHTSIPPSRFAQLLLAQLQSAGYELRIVNGNAPPDLDGAYSYLLDYEISKSEAGTLARQAEPATDPAAGTYTFVISAGAIKLKRDYITDPHGVMPASSMYVLGADASALVLDRSLFKSRATSTVGLPQVSRQQNAPPAQPMAQQPAQQSIQRSALQPVPIKHNMYATGQSNYASIFRDYDTLEKQIMVFANDSLVMGAGNKALAQSIISKFDPQRDVISVIGCSHGATRLRNGNTALANGRSYRVKEEFMMGGIDADLVLEEGCWSSVAFDKMPPRGVVVTHKRERS